MSEVDVCISRGTKTLSSGTLILNTIVFHITISWKYRLDMYLFIWKNCKNFIVFRSFDNIIYNLPTDFHRMEKSKFVKQQPSYARTMVNAILASVYCTWTFRICSWTVFRIETKSNEIRRTPVRGREVSISRVAAFMRLKRITWSTTRTCTFV